MEPLLVVGRPSSEGDSIKLVEHGLVEVLPLVCGPRRCRVGANGTCGTVERGRQSDLIR